MHKYRYITLIAFATGTIAVIVLLFYGKLIPDTNQGAIYFAKDIISVIVAIASFAVGTYYARKAQIFQKDLADRKAEIKLLINRNALIPDDPLGIREVAFGYSVEKGARVLCVIPFVVRNDGELSARDVYLRVTLPANVSAYGLTEINTKRILGDLEGIGFRRKSYEFDHFWIIDYLIPVINPGERFVVEELVDVTCASTAEFNVDAVTRDKVPVTVEYQLSLASEVSVSLSAADTKLLSNFFIIKSYKTKDEKEIGKRIMREREEFLGEKLRKLNAGEATAGAKPVDLLRKAIVVIPELGKIAETKEHRHFTAVYVERPKQSKRWVLDPAPKDGIVEINLKRLMSQGTSETRSHSDH